MGTGNGTTNSHDYLFPEIGFKLTFKELTMYVGFYILHGIYASILLIAGWFIAEFIGWFFSLILRMFLFRCLQRNEDDGFKMYNDQREFASKYPWSLGNMTYNRLIFFRLTIGWLIFGFTVFAIIYAERAYIAVFLPWIAGIFFYFRGVVSTEHWMVSLMARFYIHYMDIIRINQCIIYNKHCYQVLGIWPINTPLRRISPDTCRDDLLRITNSRSQGIGKKNGIADVRGDLIYLQNYVFLGGTRLSFYYDMTYNHSKQTV